ncbi:hypothetical protein IJQ51_02620 [Candidatus Saccharibacteria bacterium]|nr:hypothetical protein [Candidatus Saccharibacteria bacterium]
MKKVFRVILPMLVCGVLAVVAGASASALTLQEGAQAAQCDGCPANLFGENGVFRQVTNAILYIVGIVAVIMLIIGGIKYVVSGGDAKKVTDAKNTVLYAIIGLVICFFAFAIVNFVILSLPSDQETTGALIQSIYG